MKEADKGKRLHLCGSLSPTYESGKEFPVIVAETVSPKALMLPSRMRQLPAPDGDSSLYIRAYWPDAAITEGKWIPPEVRKVK